MTDEQHDEAALPEDAVEDLAPEGDEQDVSGGAVDAFLKVEGASSQKVDIETNSFQWGVG